MVETTRFNPALSRGEGSTRCYAVMTDSEGFVGKPILVGLTYLQPSGDMREQLQLHGVIRRVDGHVLEFERADGAGTFTIPFDGELESAEPGALYTLRSTGEEVRDVHFLASFTIHPRHGSRGDA